eukprot:gene42316-52469_t
MTELVRNKAAEVKLKLEQGLESTLQELGKHCSTIGNLPNVALLATLKEELSEDLALIEHRLQQADFFRYAADFNTSLTTLRARVRDTVLAMQDLIKQRVKDTEVDLKRVPEWAKLTQQEQTELLGSLDRLVVQAPADLTGLTTTLNTDYELQSLVQSLKHRIEKLGQQRIKEELDAAQPKVVEGLAQEPRKPIARKVKAQ